MSEVLQVHQFRPLVNWTDPYMRVLPVPNRFFTGQERTNIPSYEDMDEFTPYFNVPAPPAKRFETPRNFQPQPDQYQNYAYNYNNQDQSKTWIA